MAIPAETKRRLAEDDRRWKFKYHMRAVATLFSFIALVIFAVTVSESKGTYGGNDWVDGMPIAPLLLALVYNPLKIFLTISHRHGKAIHPGWDIALDLLIWGLALPALVFSVGDGWFWFWQPVEIQFDDFVPCDNDFNFWSQPCNTLIYTLGKMEIAANVFLAFVLILHFVLFVFACIATHKWRMAKKRAAVQSRNIALQYHRSPEEHMEQQPPAYYPSEPSSHSEGDSRGTMRDSMSPVSPVCSGEENAFKYA